MKAGDSVKKAQVIAVTAQNGFICAPQLDFGIYQDESHLYGSGQMKSIPLLFDGLPDGGTAYEGLEGVAAAPKHPRLAVEMAITVDDLPVHGALPPGMSRFEIARKMLDVFGRHHLRGVYGFINGHKLQEEPQGRQLLKEWVKRGQLLGNHALSHKDLNTTSVSDYEADILGNEAILSELSAGGDFRWFRYPFLDEGPTQEKRDQVREFLKRTHYSIAQVSLTFGDWNWQDPYVRCLKAHDLKSIERLKETYLRSAVLTLGYNQALAQEITGRSVRLILLTHIGAFTAEMLDALLTAYEDQGVQFVPLAEAEHDEIYSINPNYLSEWTGPFLDQIRIARKLPKPFDDKVSRPKFDSICANTGEGG